MTCLAAMQATKLLHESVLYLFLIKTTVYFSVSILQPIKNLKTLPPSNKVFLDSLPNPIVIQKIYFKSTPALSFSPQNPPLPQGPLYNSQSLMIRSGNKNIMV